MVVFKRTFGSKDVAFYIFVCSFGLLTMAPIHTYIM